MQARHARHAATRPQYLHTQQKTSSRRACAGFLDGRYEAFGRVSSGMEVVRKIELARIGHEKQTSRSHYSHTRLVFMKLTYIII